MRTLETCISHRVPDTFQILKAFADKMGSDINECSFWISSDEKCHHLESCIPQLNNIFEMTHARWHMWGWMNFKGAEREDLVVTVQILCCVPKFWQTVTCCVLVQPNRIPTMIRNVYWNTLPFSSEMSVLGEGPYAPKWHNIANWWQMTVWQPSSLLLSQTSMSFGNKKTIFSRQDFLSFWKRRFS